MLCCRSVSCDQRSLPSALRPDLTFSLPTAIYVMPCNCRLTLLASLQVLPQDIREPLVQHENRASLLEVRQFVHCLGKSDGLGEWTLTHSRAMFRLFWILEGGPRPDFLVLGAVNT